MFGEMVTCVVRQTARDGQQTGAVAVQSLLVVVVRSVAGLVLVSLALLLRLKLVGRTALAVEEVAYQIARLLLLVHTGLQVARLFVRMFTAFGLAGLIRRLLGRRIERHLTRRAGQRTRLVRFGCAVQRGTVQ